MKTKLNNIKEDLESVETALEKKNKTLQIITAQQQEERSLVSLTNSSPQTTLTWIFIGIFLLFLCYGLLKICHKYKGVVSNVKLMLGKDPSLLHKTKSSKVVFTKNAEELKFFDTSEGSLNQDSSPGVFLQTDQTRNQEQESYTEVFLKTDQTQHQKQNLSMNTDSPSTMSKQLFHGSHRSLTSEHSYYKP